MRRTKPSSSKNWRVCASIFSLTPPILRRRSLKRCVPASKATNTNTPQRLLTCWSTTLEGQSGSNNSPLRSRLATVAGRVAPEGSESGMLTYL
ncbi:hypothetical protein EMIT0357P_50224 [Pseudomonas marginalis]